MDPPQYRRPSDKVMADVVMALSDYVQAPMLKKLALYSIAYLTPGEEVIELKRAFDQFCGGHNIGTIRGWHFGKEAAKYYCLEGGSDKDKKEKVQALFQCLATKGKLGFTEFIAATLESKGLISKDRVKAAFSLFDESKGGCISPYHLRSVLGIRCRYRSSHLDYDEIMREALDKSVDANISGKDNEQRHTLSLELFMKLFGH
jgi:Ca2+-binding EF-hand superfamily protein